MTRHFDVLIIGAGSAGSVVASRLSEDAACRVGLIEAGRFPSDPDIADPLKWPALPGRDYDWAYRTVPQRHTTNRFHDWPRGKIVGGSSCLHAMAYVRGHPDDYIAWEEAGGARWSYQGLLSGFMRSESFAASDSPDRGRSGPLDVYLPDTEISPIVRAYLAAGKALGAPSLSDHNSGELAGTAPNSLNIRHGRRLSVADAYLTQEVLARPNLELVIGCDVERLVVDGARATGVLVDEDGKASTIEADRIILCAGAVSSPLILMRSGIGDPQVLKRAGIECLVERRDIGVNLQDHLLALGNVYSARKPVPPSRLQHSESLMYLHGDDMTRSTGSPDIVLACVVAPSAADGLSAPRYGSAYTILCGVTHPTSRGHIRPSGAGRDDPPIIDPHYLETEYDRATFRTALRTARAVGHHSALDEWRDAEMLPGPGLQSDIELDSFIAKAASTHHHPAGTCRMGKDQDAVVDPDLRLNGFDNVYLVDASIFPKLPSGPINASVVAVAENWAGMFSAMSSSL